MKYRVKAGTYTDKEGRRYTKDEIVETDKDLVKAFGSGKFEALGDSADVTSATDAPTNDDVTNTGEDPVVIKPRAKAASPTPTPVIPAKKKTAGKWRT